MNNPPNAISDDLLISYLLGELAVYERYQVEEWLEASPDNRKHFETLEDLWQKVELPLEIPDEWNIDKAWQAVSSRMDKAEIKQNRVRIFTHRISWFATSAAAVLAIVFLIQWLLPGSDDRIVLMAMTDKQTDTLPDGSVVVLARGTELSFAREWDEDLREVQIDGEACFIVTKDSLKPFEVHASGGTLRVLGTQFLVKTYSDTALYVSVLEGRVSLREKGKDFSSEDMVLEKDKAGMISRAFRHARTAEPAPPDEWFGYTGTLIFVDETLERVGSVLAKTHGILLQFDKPSTGRLKVTVSFRQESANEILQILAATLGLDLEADTAGKVFTLKRTDIE